MLSAIANVLSVMGLPVPTADVASVPVPLKVSVSDPTSPVKLRFDEPAVVVAS